MNVIEYYRRINGISQKELAERIGVTQTTVSKWETGQRVPDLATLIQLSKIFGVQSEALLDFDKDYTKEYENQSGKYLQIYRKKAGLTQTDVAEKMGVTKAAVSLWETGKAKPNNENLRTLAMLYKVPPELLVYGERPKAETNNAPSGKEIEVKLEVEEDDNYVNIPLVAALPCGYNSNATPFTIIKKYPVPSQYIRKWGKDIVAIKAKGNSMSPTITAGDTLICIPGELWVDNNIVVVDVNDSDTIKRIRRADDGGIDLIPDNSDYMTIHYTIDELKMYQVHVLGRVAKVIGPDLI